MKVFRPLWVAVAAMCLAASPILADDAAGPRYGPLGIFDTRSMYGKGAFPEPFLVDDSDLEVNEVRLDWLHQGSAGQTGNFTRIELEKGLGLATVELEAAYLNNTRRTFDPLRHRGVLARDEGFDNVSIGARNPLYQFVTDDESVDATVGAALEAGIPSNSRVSKNAELVPKIFGDFRLGEHFTFQTVLGHSLLFGSKPDGGLRTFEYGMVFGWSFPRRQLPLPGIEQVVPLFELRGNTFLNPRSGGNDALLGDAAFRLNLRPVGPVQPRVGLGYVFPLDKGGKDELRWGIYTSAVFEF